MVSPKLHHLLPRLDTTLVRFSGTWRSRPQRKERLRTVLCCTAVQHYTALCSIGVDWSLFCIALYLEVEDGSEGAVAHELESAQEHPHPNAHAVGQQEGLAQAAHRVGHARVPVLAQWVPRLEHRAVPARATGVSVHLSQVLRML